MATEPKFKKGQVVLIDTDHYKEKAHRGEQFQKITRVWPWTSWKNGVEVKLKPGVPAWGYSFANGDECNEKFLKPLTKQQIGVTA